MISKHGGVKSAIFVFNNRIQFWKTKKSQLISNDQNDSKFNISTTLGLKIMKLLPRNPTYQGLSKNTNNFPSFL
jgi:hypothetical protein